MPRIFLHIFILFFAAVLPLQVHALSVDSVRFGAHPDKTRMVLELSDVSDFRVFVLENPYRVVIDMPQFDWRAGAGADSRSGIRNVRHGNLKAGISRVVFDVDRPVSLKSAFVLPRQGAKPNRLVVDFSNVSPAVFQAQKGKVLGTLDIEDAAYGMKSVNSRQAGAYRTASVGAVAPPAVPAPTIKPLVIIDPGHGGVDPGAIGANGVHEKVVALALAKELKRQLLETGRYRVKLTREDDRFIKLYNRVKFARQHEGNLFISIHADSLTRPNVRGASVYTLSEVASDAQTAKLAARENKADLIAGVDLDVEDKEVANILVDLAMRDTMNQSKYFANTLVDRLQGNGVRLLEKPHRYAGFAVLKAPDIPSVLVEAGFMSNRKEADLLNTAGHRRKIAEALTDGINAYFKTVAENERS